MNLNACVKWAVMMAALLLLAFDASAQDPQQRGRGEGAGPQGPTSQGRPTQFAPGDDASGRGWHMSREERRQLRRDVNEAGRDIYPERRRAHQRERNPASSAKSPQGQASAQ